jgi:LDH2 family malate/lactate/ureidoglycolate dehydrogenase
MLIEADRLGAWATTLLGKWGYNDEDAAFLATTLVDANTRGVDSHGVIRLPAYQRRIAEKLVATDARPIVTVDGAVVKVDANRAAGQFAARAAVGAALEVSRTSGVATAGVHGSTHFGTAGFYARWLAERGTVAIVVSNSEPAVVPFGGKEALLGTNPFAFAAPTHGDPISLDMATSTSAMGKVFVAQAEGRSVPDTWGVDAEGNPTTDPHAIKSLLPVGGPKGYGLGFLIEILGGVLTGAAFSHGLGNMYSDFSKPQDIGHWMVAIDIERFMPLNAFKDRMQQLTDEAHSSAPAPGFTGVLVPGEPEENTRRSRLADGIPLADTTVEELRELGAQFSVAFPGEDSK